MNIITKLNIRQRVMLVLTILAAAFLTWQIYNFVHGNSPLISPPKTMGAKTSAPVSMTASKTVTLATPAKAENNTFSPVVQPLPTELAASDLSPRQQEYLNLVREYQITKMKRQILEEQAGLANAKKRIADAGKGNVVVAGYDNSFAENPLPLSNYQLMYVDRQAGQWTATLNQGGQYIEVHLGTRLADGSIITSIDEKEVTVRSVSGRTSELSFPGSVNVVDMSQGSRVHTQTNAPAMTNSNPSNAQIAKILGITSAPVTPVTSDVPAGPLTVEGKPAAPANNNPAPNSSNPSNSQAAPVSGVVSPVPSIKPVSVKELRAHRADASNLPPPVALNSNG